MNNIKSATKARFLGDMAASFIVINRHLLDFVHVREIRYCLLDAQKRKSCVSLCAALESLAGCIFTNTQIVSRRSNQRFNKYREAISMLRKEMEGSSNSPAAISERTGARVIGTAEALFASVRCYANVPACDTHHKQLAATVNEIWLTC